MKRLLPLLLAACGPTDRLVAVYATDAAAPADARCAPAACRAPAMATAFRYALCVCDVQNISGALATDSFDSAAGPYASPARRAGAVGSNGAFTASGRVDIAGSLRVAATQGVTAQDLLRVSGALLANGPLQGAADATLADASFRGDVTARDLRVRGALTLPTGAVVRSTGVSEVARTVRADVSVPPPCDCATQRATVAALVAARRDDNDNAAAGLAADLLSRADRPERVTIPCGRFSFRGDVRGATLALDIVGRAAVFLDGEVSLDVLRVTLGPGAEVALYVTGNVNVSRALGFGDPAHPARASMILGGQGGITLAGDAVFGGNLLAPEVELRLSGDATLYGSVLVRALTASGNLTVHYDEAALDPVAVCASPATCASCRDCPQRACVDGRCGPCRDDGECCAPLRCAAGLCVPEAP